jgi:hypothetical protein
VRLLLVISHAVDYYQEVHLREVKGEAAQPELRYQDQSIGHSQSIEENEP